MSEIYWCQSNTKQAPAKALKGYGISIFFGLHFDDLICIKQYPGICNSVIV